MIRFVIPTCAVICLLPIISPAIALLSGILIAYFFGNPYSERTNKYTKTLLAVSIVGLGAGMDLNVIIQAGITGLAITAASIIAIFICGMLIGRFLNTDKEASILITAGTAICGGSAIAAMAPVIGAKDKNISIALGIVFILNAIALIIFPPIGQALELSQEQFGLWSALAIHDTSSVVGATSTYGDQSLEIGTTVKLTRALWIIPLVLAAGIYMQKISKSKNSNDEQNTYQKTPIKKPWFILGFVIMAAIVTWIPIMQSPGQLIHDGARRLLVLTLFLIGLGLTKDTIKSVGIRPLIQGSLLWIITLSISLGLITAGLLD